MAQPLGLVTIKRTKGRIPGFAALRIEPKVLVCGTNRVRKKHGKRMAGWSFPPAVRELLLRSCQGETVLHLFGGQATFGHRLDIDASTNPDRLGDAFLAHRYFERDSFDHVILDPPYSMCELCFRDLTIRNSKKPELPAGKRKKEIRCLMETAAWIARKHVWWFHTLQIATHRVLPMDQCWTVLCGNQCTIRILQRFKVLEPKRHPPDVSQFERGPALKYKRWIPEQPPILFSNVDYSTVLGRDPRAEAKP